MERRAIAISGTVQGVGFRPFVHALARRLKLVGFVRNLGGAVEIEVEGTPAQLEEFHRDLIASAPPLARIEQMTWRACAARGDTDFTIEKSVADAGPVVISPDIATCDDCLAELFDPHDRRFSYPFLNCTNCGPRLTIVKGAPYDRARTTMAAFSMCALCQAEYDDPANRRFHAQPTACPACGPQVQAADGLGRAIETDDPVAWLARQLIDGKIAAIKGLGGYHLACDAGNADLILELRRRKHREEKPLAVMVADLAGAMALCEISDDEQRLLTSPSRPIVLLKMLAARALPDTIAPGQCELGIMLPYTPLHHLLMHELGNRPLVMTSGNRSDEPIAIGEPEVFERLAGIADVFLTHNRPIHVRCDDSVARMVGHETQFIRRSRGYAPQPIIFPAKQVSPGLAVGGQLKATFALLSQGRAVVSHHLGDLDNFEAFSAFERDIALFEKTFDIQPTWIAHDAHPQYASTRYALRRAAEMGIPAIAVQHHHAHMASCMAEHGLDEPVIGVSFDGTGFGTDGAIWGGEFLVGDLAGFRRAAHLRYVPLPGGDAAVRQPWRMALSHLIDASADLPALRQRIDPVAWRTTQRMIERRLNSPMTSSAGRLFDAAASIIGLRDQVSFEGQAAMQLEALARDVADDRVYPWTSDSPAWTIDTRSLIVAIVGDVICGQSPAIIARRFHSTLTQMIVQTCRRIREGSGLNKVLLSGGVFLNVLLTTMTEESLAASGFSPLRHRVVPPNDGGVSLGQLAVAAKKFFHVRLKPNNRRE